MGFPCSYSEHLILSSHDGKKADTDFSKDGYPALVKARRRIIRSELLDPSTDVSATDDRTESEKLLPILKNRWNLLLILVPVLALKNVLMLSDVVIFWASFIVMIPLAKLLGDFTEELAEGLKNDMIGGLLNATLGNAVELIISISAIRRFGSVLSNLLLVLGMSFFAGGVDARGKEQTFIVQGVLINMTLLLLSCIAITMPTLFHLENPSLGTLSLSRFCCVLLASSYVAYLIFQLWSHRDMFSDEVDQEEDLAEKTEEDETTIAPLNVSTSLICLILVTVIVAWASESLVACIESVVRDWGMSKAFIGTILLPIVGNACEHLSAVRMAMENRMAITVGIAVGSSTQIAAFVIPLSVVIGWTMNKEMDMDYGFVNVILLTFATLLTFTIVTDGRSNWMEGFILIVAYLLVAVFFWCYPGELYSSFLDIKNIALTKVLNNSQ